MDPFFGEAYPGQNEFKALQVKAMEWHKDGFWLVIISAIILVHCAVLFLILPTFFCFFMMLMGQGMMEYAKKQLEKAEDILDEAERRYNEV